MPTNMGMQSMKKHGYVEELLPGHPYAEQAQKHEIDIVKQRNEAKKTHTSKSGEVTSMKYSEFSADDVSGPLVRSMNVSL